MIKKTVTDLLVELQCNNLEAEQELIERFAPMIRSYGIKSGWQLETEDMRSILTIKLIETSRSMRVDSGEAKNVAFIANSIRNHFMDVVRKINKGREVEMVGLDSVAETGEADKNNVIFLDIIKGLDAKKKTIITLKYCEMYTDKEIAEELGITRQAVHKHLTRAYEQLSGTTN